MSKTRDPLSTAMAKFIFQFTDWGDALRFEQAHADDVRGLDDMDPDYWYKLADLRLAQRVGAIAGDPPPWCDASGRFMP